MSGVAKIDRQAILTKTNGHCAYCGCELTLKTMQIDHVEPLIRYKGRNEGWGTDTMDNMLPSCRSCNHYKATMNLEMFRRAIEAWPEVLLRDSVTYRNALRYGLVESKPRKVRFYFEQLADKGATR